MRRRAMWENLARHVAGECTADEDIEVHVWAAADPARREMLESARVAWEISGEMGSQWDSETAWQSLKQRMDAACAPTRRTYRPMMEQLYKATPPRSTARRWNAREAVGWGIAATVAAVLAVGALSIALGRRQIGAPDALAVQELITEKGERAQVRLRDGTRIVLGPDTRLQLLSGKDEGRREVALIGEAYFDVASDSARPFLVRAGSSLTRVLGTEFDVRAYPADSTVQVVVAEGRVSFGAPEAKGTAATLLLPGELGRLVGGATVVEKQVVDNVDSYVGWQDGRLAFEDAPLSQVAVQLERWYGMPVRVGDATLRNRRLTATFRNQTVDEVIAVIAASLELKYARVGQVYTFLPKDSAAALARS